MSTPEINQNNDSAIELPDSDIRESHAMATRGNMELSRGKERVSEFLSLGNYAGGIMKKNIEAAGSKLAGMLADQYGARSVGMAGYVMTAGHATMAGLGAMTGADLVGKISGDIILDDAFDRVRQSKALGRIMAKKDWVGAVKQECAGAMRQRLFSAKGDAEGVAS